MSEAPEDNGPQIRDKRRIDPETYELREPATPAADPAAGESAPEASSDRVAELTQELADRTSDLQRLQAEYVNYKRRVDRDRDLARQAGVEKVMNDLLKTLDDVAAARKHDDLDGGFKLIADEIDQLAAKYGVQPFGEKGERFDPMVHDAMMHSVSGEVTEPTCAEVFERGYQINDKVLRPARVAVVAPDPNAGNESHAETNES